MASSLNNQGLEAIFQEDFPDVEVVYEKITFGGNIHNFFLKFPNEDKLDKDWRKISNAIAVYFQSKQADEFGKWNTYIFYLFDRPVKKDLKYRIENDTFSSRKILIEREMSYADIITEHIVNDNLKTSKHNIELTNPELFNPDPVIWSAINGKQIRGKRSVNSTAEEVLDAITNALNPGSNEI